MANKKRFKRIIIMSDSEDSGSDEDFHQSHPLKKPRPPNQDHGDGFITWVTPREQDLNDNLPSSSNDIYRSNNVIVISDDDDDNSISEETSIRKRLRTSDTEAVDTSKRWESPVVISDSDDDGYILITTTTAVTDKDPYEYRDESTSEESTSMCNICDSFLEEITSPTSAYVTNFQETKQELVTRLFHLYNRTVFENKLPNTIQITWNKRLTQTSAQCVNLCTDGNRHSRIEISEKVCDSAERVRDTLIHEMCHAACWNINGIQNDGHGPLWWSYAQKVTCVHPGLPAVSMYHTYHINYKYNYMCAWCPNRVGRFSVINDERAYCRKCGGRLLIQKTTQDMDRPSTSPSLP